jgi:chromosome segregation ATPase
MITPRQKRQLPDNLQLNLTLIDVFDTDDVELQERRDAFVKTVHYLLMERPQLEELFRGGRVKTLTLDREKLVETLNAKGDEIDAHNIEQAKVLASINTCNREQAQAKAALDVLKEPPNKSRLTDKQWENYETQLKAAGEESKLADRGAANALAKLPAWENAHKVLKQQYENIERQIQVLDYDRGCLDGSVNPSDPKRRIHDANTGLQVRGPGSGFIRSTNP